MGSGQKILTRVSPLWFGFEKFPLKMSNFSIFSLLVIKISSDWVKKYPGQRRVSLFLLSKASFDNTKASLSDFFPLIT